MAGFTALFSKNIIPGHISFRKKDTFRHEQDFLIEHITGDNYLIERSTNRKFPLDKVGFYGDTMVLDFHDEIWKSRYTDFFKEVKVDDRDKEYFSSLIEVMTATPVEMLQFID